MSIAAGIVFATTTLVTFTWATLGRQLAVVPAVAKAVAYLDGGFRMPNDAYVDELMRVHETERAFGLAHEDDEMPGMRGMTYGEVIKMEATKPCVSDAAIEAAPLCLAGEGRSADGTIVQVVKPHHDGLLGWLRGGYNMPKTHDEVDAFPPHTQRGLCRWAIPDGFVFDDEPPHAAHLPNPTGLCD